MAKTNDFFAQVERIILLRDAQQKCSATQALAQQLRSTTERLHWQHATSPLLIPLPGLPPELQLVPPRQLKRRGIATQDGRNALMHAIAHIEFNAINLALDAAYRFRNQPPQYYRDWLSVAADEARHFNLVNEYLMAHGSHYGALPVHNGLWEMAVETAHDVMARMALVPRVMEARGLDVTPKMIEKFQSVADQRAVEILDIIYRDEIGHVAIGTHWFKHHCTARGLAPRTTFKELVDQHLHGELRGPFNVSARLLAGFDEEELASLG